jgi:hypothetical protein
MVRRYLFVRLMVNEIFLRINRKQRRLIIELFLERPLKAKRVYRNAQKT